MCCVHNPQSKQKKAQTPCQVTQAQFASLVLPASVHSTPSGHPRLNLPGHPTLSLSWAFGPELSLPTSFPYFLFLLPIRLSPPWQGCVKAQLRHHAQHTAGTQYMLSEA